MVLWSHTQVVREKGSLDEEGGHYELQKGLSSASFAQHLLAIVRSTERRTVSGGIMG